MNTKKVIASFAVELTEKESGSVWITVTPLELSEDFSVPVATAMSSVIFEMSRKLSNGLQPTYGSRLLYRC